MPWPWQNRDVVLPWFASFTDRARIVVKLANQEARRLNHEYVGTEHILLGLVREGKGVAGMLLRNLEIDSRTIQDEAEKIVQSGPDKVATKKLIKTPQVKKMLESAIEEARTLDHNYVGTEHLLLGLLRVEEGLAAQILKKLGLNPEVVRKALLELMNPDPKSN
jgi:ATP-dependent Clp protease ATP-binding subunit ClpC